jgi:hypothetical protein
VNFKKILIMKKLFSTILITSGLVLVTSFSSYENNSPKACVASLEVRNFGSYNIKPVTVTGTDLGGNAINFLAPFPVGVGATVTKTITITSGGPANGLNLTGGSLTTLTADTGTLTIYQRNSSGTGPLLGTFHYHTAVTTHSFTLTANNLCFGVIYEWTDLP